MATSGWRYRKAFAYFPRELFRVNQGSHVRLHAANPLSRPAGTVDILVNRLGIVRAKAMNPLRYQFPNGLPLHPNTPRQQKVIRQHPTDSLYIYSVPAGTVLPDDLLLINDFRDHYSIQPREDMLLEELNSKIAHFFKTKATRFTKEEWLTKYPKATDDDELE